MTIKSLLLLSLLHLLGALGASGQGDLNIFSPEGRMFHLYLNGERLTDEPVSDLRVHDLGEWRRQFRVELADGSGAVEKSLTPRAGWLTNYELVAGRGGWDLRFHSEAVLGAAPAEALPPAPEDFERLLAVVAGQSFPATLAVVAELVARTNCLRVEQVSALMAPMPFDEQKLAVAKAAYRNCADPQNYFVLQASLVHPSSGQALGDFVAAQGAAQGRWAAAGGCFSACPWPMGQAEFERAVAMLSVQVSPRAQAQALLEGGCLRSGQALALLGLFPFDSDKMPLAELAFERLFDQGNAALLLEAFAFDDARRQLAQRWLARLR